MARWVPDGRDALDDVTRRLVALFANAEQRLLAVVAAQLRAGLEAGTPLGRAVRVGELRRDAEQIVAALRLAYPDEVARIMRIAAEWGVEAALQELSVLADVPDVTSPRRLPGALAAQSMTADLSSALDVVAARILRFPDDVYRRAVAASATDVVLGMGTTATAQSAAWQRLIRGGVTGFVDRANRRWNLATYVEMATRTATRRAWEDQHVATMRQNGVDLVSVVVGRGACRECSVWAGRILRTDDGPTGRLRVPNVAGSGDVTVKVAGTLTEARAHGWRHPNCRCTVVAYLPGLSVVEDVTTYDPDAEAARQRLRHLEREVRRAKGDEAAAVDDVQRAAARARVRELQSRIRAHVAETGVMRQRNRERPNLGNQVR